MSAKDKKAAGNSNRPNAQCQRGVSRAQQLLMVALVCVVTAGVVVLTGIWPQEDTVIVEPAPIAPAPTAPPVEETPPISLPEPAIPAVVPTAEPAVEPLPSLFESDDAVRDALAAIPLGTAGQQYLMPSNIIERSASLIYLTAQGDVPYKLVPIARPKAAFPIVDDGTQVVRIQMASPAMTPSHVGSRALMRRHYWTHSPAFCLCFAKHGAFTGKIPATLTSQ